MGEAARRKEGHEGGRGRGPEPRAAGGRGLKRAGARVPPPRSLTHGCLRPREKEKKNLEGNQEAAQVEDRTVASLPPPLSRRHHPRHTYMF